MISINEERGFDFTGKEWGHVKGDLYYKLNIELKEADIQTVMKFQGVAQRTVKELEALMREEVNKHLSTQSDKSSEGEQ